jgi:hypothetical protein
MTKIKLSNGDEIEMREPKVKDVRIVSADGGSEQEQEIKLIGNLTGISPDEIDDLSMKDYMSLSGALKDFLS